MGRGARAALAAVYLGVFLAGLGAGLSRLALARLLRYGLGESVLVTSSLTSWFMAARVVSALLGGVGSDLRPGLYRVLMSLPMAGIAAIVYVIAGLRDAAAVLLLNAAWGFLSGLVWPVTQAATSLAAGARAGTAMGVYFASAFLGVTIGQGLYGVLPLGDAAAVRFSSLFFAAASASLAAAASLLPQGLLRRPGRGARGLLAAIRDALRGPAAWLLLAAFAVGYSSGMLREFLYVYLGEAYGLTRRDLSAVLAAAGLAALPLTVLVGRLAEKRGAAPVLYGVLVVGAAGLAVLALPAGTAGAFAGVMLSNLATRTSLPLTRNAVFLGTSAAATLVAASNVLNNLGQVTGPLVAGALYDALHGERILGAIPGSGTPFLTAAALYLLVLALYPSMAQRRQGSE